MDGDGGCSPDHSDRDTDGRGAPYGGKGAGNSHGLRPRRLEGRTTVRSDQVGDAAEPAVLCTCGPVESSGGCCMASSQLFL
jgi:hypothetical protein